MDKSSFHTSDIEKVELMHECSPEHLRKRTVKLKYNKETGEEEELWRSQQLGDE